MDLEVGHSRQTLYYKHGQTIYKMKEIIEIRTEINDIENRNKRKFMEPEVDF